MTHLNVDVNDYHSPAKGVIKDSSPKERRAAIKVVCANATSPRDAAFLLEVLGIDPEEEYSVQIPSRR